LFDYQDLGGHPLSTAGGILLSLVLGAGSYFLIERRAASWLFRRERGSQIGLLAVGGLCLVSLGIFASHGLRAIKFPAHQPDVVATADRIAEAAQDWTFPKTCGTYSVTDTGLRLCRQGGQGKVTTLVIGDSYGEEIAPRYESLPDGPLDPAVLIATRPGCVPLPGVQLGGSIKDCAASTREAMALANSGSFSKIVVVASWLGAFAETAGEPSRGRVCFPSPTGCRASGNPTVYDRDAAEAFGRLAQDMRGWRAKGADVTVIKTFPQAKDASPKKLFSILYRDRTLADHGIRTSDMRATASYPNRLVDSLAAVPGVTLLDPLDYLCTDECPLVVDGTPLFYDVSHIRASTVNGPSFAFLDPAILPKTAPN
jgi:hypothetical protein